MFKAKYAGKCAACKGSVEPGATVDWMKVDGKDKIRHLECPPATEPYVNTQTTYFDAGTGKSTQATLVPEPTKLEALDDKSPWYDVLAHIINWANKEKKYLRILLIGPPGTGKSTTAAILAGIPESNRKTLHQKQAVEELVGMFHLKSGATVFQEVCIASAMREGKPFLLDELDRWSPEVESSAYGWMDDKPHCSLPTGELRQAQPGYMVLGTSNANVTSLPDALLDRIDVVMACMIPHPGALAQFADESMKSCVLNYFRGLPAATWTWAGKPTVRRMRAFHMLKPVIGELHASQCAFGSAGREIIAALQTAARSASGSIFVESCPDSIHSRIGLGTPSGQIYERTSMLSTGALVGTRFEPCVDHLSNYLGLGYRRVN